MKPETLLVFMSSLRQVYLQYTSEYLKGPLYWHRARMKVLGLMVDGLASLVATAPQPQTLNPTPQTFNPKPQTLNPQTLNPKPPNPKP